MFWSYSLLWWCRADFTNCTCHCDLQPPTANETRPFALPVVVHRYISYALLLPQLLLLLNVGIALAPLLRKQDPCEDIPLSPRQRQLLGLPPVSRPATPQDTERWITPPRYSRSRSATPQSNSSLRAHPSDSPLEGRGTPYDGFALASGSSFGSARTHTQSPMSMNARGAVEQRRLSYNARSSPLSMGDFDAVGNSTPTKINRASVGLNSKWLYERGKSSPNRFTSAWGTGSVFN